ncbi:MAG: D-2-hydroxyacid dehydrogenase [Ruminococcaceae bacterium]|nr:D-2-hydroxyacid dehydrogenase [Oscillospiraceae bacterium]
MKIVVLDGYAANPGDLSWDAISALGEFEYHDRINHADAAKTIGDAEIVLTNKVPITAEIMDCCKNLKYIGVLATGYNIIDTAAAKAKGITVCNIPAYSTTSVTQFVFALMLEYCCHVAHHSDTVHAGKWSAHPDFTYWDYPLVELWGKTLAVVGFGSIGRSVSTVAQALGMKVLAVAHHPEKVGDTGGAELVTMDEAFARADFITLHTPLTAETTNLINSDSIAKMKDGVVIINTARGPLVNDADMRAALDSGKVACFATDVLSQEPPRDGNPLIGAKNCIITPHIAWAPLEARQRLFNICAENIKSWMDGKPQNVVG